MLAAKDLQSIARACTAVSNDVAEASGFVSVRRLLERFDVSLVLRPLLVEGMLASFATRREESPRSKLTVLVDSETFPVTEKDIAMEASNGPLPVRFRNTVAHELLHSLAYRPGEFGLRLEQPPNNEKRVTEFVKAIEQETERLTPLLLWPEKALDQLIDTRSNPITPGDISLLAAELGISRQVAITRLRLRQHSEGIVYAKWLRDTAIGLVEWTEKGRAVFRKWPLFINFDRNIIPSFLYIVAAQDRLPTSSVFEDSHFAMQGGESTSMSALVEAGLKESPSMETMSVLVSVEGGSRKPGTEAIYVVRKRRANEMNAAISHTPQD